MYVQIQTDPQKKGTLTVTPHGPIDSDHYLDFDEKIKPLLVPSTKNILVDLANVDYISSAGLGVLFTMRKFLKKNGGDLLFCNIKPQVKRIFEIVNALPPETLFQSTQEADEYLYKMMQKEIDKEKGDSL